MGKIAENARPVQGWEVPTLPQFIEEAEKAATWLVQGLLLDGAVALCSGPKKRAAKSYWAMTVAIGMAAGKKFGLWQPMERVPVLYCIEEGPKAPTANRLLAICASLQVDYHTLTNMHFGHRHGIKLDNKDWHKRVINKVRELKTKLLVLDPIGYMYEGDENKTQDMQKVRDTVGAVTREGCTVLLIHHLVKNEDPREDVDKQVRGSGVVTDQYDTHIALRRYDASSPTIDMQLRHKDFPWKRYNVRWHFKNEPSTERVLKADMHIEDPKATFQTEIATCFQTLALNHKYSLARLQEQWSMPRGKAALIANHLEELRLIEKRGGSWWKLEKVGSATQKDVNVDSV